MAEMLGHSQTKGRANKEPKLRPKPARQSSTLPGTPFFIPSHAIRFAERAEAVKGPKCIAQLSGLPLSVACVSQRLDA